MIRLPDARSDYSRQGEAEVRILNFKTTCSEFHHLPRFGPKQLCGSAHLGCTHEVITTYKYQQENQFPLIEKRKLNKQRNCKPLTKTKITTYVLYNQGCR